MFIYRKTPSFGDRVLKKVLDQPQKPRMFWDRNGFYACRRCKACQPTNTHIRGLSSFTSTVNGREFDINEFISCNSTQVVYVLQCPCGLMYIGRTKRTLAKQVSEHIYNILIGFKDQSVSFHFRCKHNRDPSGLLFWGIEKLSPRGGVKIW